LHYIRRQNPIPVSGSANASSADAVRETVVRAYELALKEAGMDIAAGHVWREYIAFLGEKEVSRSRLVVGLGRWFMWVDAGGSMAVHQYVGSADSDGCDSKGLSPGRGDPLDGRGTDLERVRRV
jgi:hypothetical protein